MRHVRGSLLLWALGTAAVGCGGDTTAPTTDGPGGSAAASSFESDLPAGSAGANGPTRGAAAADHDDASVLVPNQAPVTPTVSPSGAPGVATAGSFGTKSGADESAGEAERAISEADIIQLQGDTLYALSRVAGLAIIDTSQPDALRLLGRYRDLPATPFELYLRDGVALVMFTGWGQYVKVDNGYSWVSTSKLLALDVADPAHVSALGSFDVPGTISDSRVVGDILYIVGYQSGGCWGCQQNKQQTSILSLSVADPKNVKKVDELFYADSSNPYGSGQKSIAVTAKRIYVAGPEYGMNGPVGSTVQVVDISDPQGDLAEGGTVQVDGQIQSRWQMDEFDSVLRVVSQPLQWFTPQGNTFTEPTVQTFQIESSQKLVELGQTTIKLPMRETLRSARFDGPRGYVITAEQKDPLFTIDLSDPVHPRQAGEVMLPGFIWHMEPRGERLLGVGFDQGNPAGGLAVSLFDVKDLDHPALLQRVNFGGSYAYLPEDQDRAHKVFRVLDDAGLILVPFSGYDGNIEGNCKGGGSTAGVELIDFQADTLKVRGAAEVVGEARRAFLQHDRLLTVGDERVQAFDIADRSAPKQTSAIVLARQVNQALQLENDLVARVSYDTSTGAPRIDFVGVDQAGEANESLAELDLATTVTGQNNGCGAYLSADRITAQGSQLQVLYRSSDNSARQTRGFAILDASQASSPKLLSNTTWDASDNWDLYYGSYSYGYYGNVDPIARTNHAVAMLETTWISTPVSSTQRLRLRVLDLRDPAHVDNKVVMFDEVAVYSGLVTDGDTLLTSHMTVNVNDGTKGRFYVDRFDLSDPSAPRRLESVNVPGALMHYDGKSQHALTSELKHVDVPDLTPDECYARFVMAEWNPQGNGNVVSGTAASAPRAASGSSGAAADGVAVPIPEPEQPKALCRGYTQTLHLVKLGSTSASLSDSYELPEDRQISGSSMGDGRVFAISSHGGNYARGFAVPAVDIAVCSGCGYVPPTQEPADLLVLGGFASDHFEIGQLEVKNADDAKGFAGFWGTPNVYAHGSRALLVSQNDAAVIDAATPSAPEITKHVTLIAGPSFVDLQGSTALLTLGAQGVQWVSLN